LYIQRKVVEMNIRVQKWGNSLALRIPKVYAEQIGLSVDSPVAISLDGNRLVIEPAREHTLDDLLANVTPDNLHGETDWGRPVGKEDW
jgi:antitoxin MazE